MCTYLEVSPTGWYAEILLAVDKRRRKREYQFWQFPLSKFLHHQSRSTTEKITQTRNTHLLNTQNNSACPSGPYFQVNMLRLLDLWQKYVRACNGLNTAIPIEVKKKTSYLVFKAFTQTSLFTLSTTPATDAISFSSPMYVPWPLTKEWGGGG